ncbi:MAG: hypothetical protein PHS14_07135 [Elusimicrobia bacterium]|nr:hypothetical protein [Elusimicrobiota bacterium]
MIAAALWFAVAAASAASFPLEEPPEPAAAASSAPIQALFGETPPLLLVAYLPEDRALRDEERAALFREVGAARDFYRRAGLLVRVEDQVVEARGAGSSAEEVRRRLVALALLRPGLTLVFAPMRPPRAGADFAVADLREKGDVLRALRGLFGSDPAALKRRFPFPLPNPAILKEEDRPAARAYRATEKDFRLLDRALAGVWKEAPELYPEAPGAVDVILQDTGDFYIYSLNENYPYPKAGRRGKYQVYRLPHDERPPEHEMWGCAAGPPQLFPVLERRVIAERAIRCSPWGTFRRKQEEKKTIYRFEEGYLATLIHEFGHAYEDMREMDPTEDMREIRRRVRAVKLAPKVNREWAEREAYAQWCELRGARALYPGQFRRLMEQAKSARKDTEYGHAAGLRVAADMLEARDRKK